MRLSRIRDVKLPTRANDNDAGIDFFIPNDWNDGAPKWLSPGNDALIPSGIKVDVPEGYALMAFNKSGVATKKQLIAGAAVVDEGYQGELHIHVINAGGAVQRLIAGDKIMQFILIPMFYDKIEEVPEGELFEEESNRGDGGFGSTGE
tara:strand:- start:824 stop:1267 length:444 start_codon:yes stop_codon:yes gene_type:complete